MRYISLTLILLSISFSLFASCEDQLSEIEKTQSEINAIRIPELTYTPDRENCSKVQPTLEAIQEITPRLQELLSSYEEYYQSCDRSMDIIYAIEETKMNIILMSTLSDLANNLALECK